MSLKLTFFRWFHDGCCQCVGSPCQARAENQFGIDQSRWEEIEIWKRGRFCFGPLTITLSTGAKNARCLKTRMIYRTRRWSWWWDETFSKTWGADKTTFLCQTVRQFFFSGEHGQWRIWRVNINASGDRAGGRMRKSFFWKMSTRVPLKGLFACQHRALVNKQTNKQNCQIIFFDACKMWWYWKDLKSGKTLCSKSVDTFQNGQLFKNPTLYDAYVWHVSKWAIIQEPSCMRLMWSSLFAELFFPTKWAQRQRPGEFHRIVDCVDPFVNALWT